MLNKNAIDKLLALPDDRFASMLKILLSASGVTMEGKPMDAVTIRKIRAVLEEVTDGDLERITQLIARYQNGG